MNTVLNCEVSTLDGNLLENYRNSNRLNLQHRKLYRIEANAFDNFPDFVSINLASNSLNTLPENCFRNTSKVSSLILDSNSISIIPMKEISILSELKELSLSYNLITSLHRPFIDFNKLLQLNLSHNFIEKIDRQTFAYSINLQMLDLSWNRLDQIDHLAFLFLRNLQLLYLNNNCLRIVYETILMFMPNLKILQLQDNKLIGLPSKMFTLSTELTLLNLDNNLIPKYDNSLLFCCKSLKHLVVHLIDEINFLDFSVLEKLETISIYFDSDKHFSFFDYFIPYSFLNKLQLVDFKLVVKYLQIRKYNLFQLPANLKNLHIECLNVDYRETGKLKFSKQLRETPQLKRLALIGLNGLNIVQWNVFKREPKRTDFDLEYLNFSRSILKASASIIQPQFQNLKHLDLSFCDVILNFKQAFNYLINLEFLSLQGIKMLKIRRLLFARNPKLKHLILEDCSIFQIQKHAFVMLKELVYLNLRRNPIEELKKNSFLGLDPTRTDILF